MKDMSSHNKLVKHKKRKRHSSGSQSESSGSDNETVPVIKYVANSDSDHSSRDDTSHKVNRKLKKHKHHHHNHHKRKHKRKDLERGRHDGDEELQLIDDSYASRQTYHRRHGDSRIRMKEDFDSHSSRHRQPRDDSGERIRHPGKRDLGESRHRRDDVSREKRSSIERESTNQLNTGREKRGDPSETGKKRFKNDDHKRIPANRPIKQERMSEEKEYEWGKQTSSSNDKKNIPAGEKAKPNFGLSGKLAEETNTFNGVVLKYSEPPEARKPKRRWRFYPFKGDEGLPTLYLHRQSCYLIGRDRKVADIPVDHPSCSKQHAALQYRLVPYQRDDGSTGHRVRPYIIDLESSNGTYVNNNKIEPKKYIELLEKDVIKFGYSSREYVLLHEQSKDDTMDDDIRGNE